MHQIRFRLGLRPRPRWGAYSAPPDPLAGFKGPTSKGRGGGGRGEKGGGKEEERGREKGGQGRGDEGRRSMLSRPTFQLVPTPLQETFILWSTHGINSPNTSWTHRPSTLSRTG